MGINENIYFLVFKNYFRKIKSAVNNFTEKLRINNNK